MSKIKICAHIRQASQRTEGVTPAARGCVECLRSGSEWVHLRLCLTCGHVGCCDESPNRHATKHAHSTSHPVIRSFEPGEDWAYCYPHDQLVDELEAFPEEIAPVHYYPPTSSVVEP